MNKYHRTRKFKRGDVCTFQSFGRYEHGMRDDCKLTVQSDEDNGVVQIKFDGDKDSHLVSFMYLELEKSSYDFQVHQENWYEDDGDPESDMYGTKLIISAVEKGEYKTPLIDIRIPKRYEGLTEQEAYCLSERIIEVLKSFPL